MDVNVLIMCFNIVNIFIFLGLFVYFITFRIGSFFSMDVAQQSCRHSTSDNVRFCLNFASWMRGGGYG